MTFVGIYLIGVCIVAVFNYCACTTSDSVEVNDNDLDGFAGYAFDEQ